MSVTFDTAVLLSHLNLDGDEVDQAALDRAHAAAVAAVENHIGSELSEPVPAPLETAVLHLTAHFYETRDLVSYGSDERPFSLPYSVFELINPYRSWSF
ncbi:MAG: head-tail connector protein [Beijerinckiaceae bacterium]